MRGAVEDDIKPGRIDRRRRFDIKVAAVRYRSPCSESQGRSRRDVAQDDGVCFVDVKTTRACLTGESSSRRVDAIGIGTNRVPTTYTCVQSYSCARNQVAAIGLENGVVCRRDPNRAPCGGDRINRYGFRAGQHHRSSGLNERVGVHRDIVGTGQRDGSRTGSLNCAVYGKDVRARRVDGDSAATRGNHDPVSQRERCTGVDVHGASSESGHCGIDVDRAIRVDCNVGAAGGCNGRAIGIEVGEVEGSTIVGDAECSSSRTVEVTAGGGDGEGCGCTRIEEDVGCVDVKRAAAVDNAGRTLKTEVAIDRCRVWYGQRGS